MYSTYCRGAPSSFSLVSYSSLSLPTITDDSVRYFRFEIAPRDIRWIFFWLSSSASSDSISTIEKFPETASVGCMRYFVSFFLPIPPSSSLFSFSSSSFLILHSQSVCLNQLNAMAWLSRVFEVFSEKFVVRGASVQFRRISSLFRYRIMNTHGEYVRRNSSKNKSSRG